MEITRQKENVRYMLEKARDGGFIVWSSIEAGFDKRAMFACSKVEDAYAYMNGQFVKDI